MAAYLDDSTPIYTRLLLEQRRDDTPRGGSVRFGQWRPLGGDWDRQPALTTPDIICLHTMVGTLAGTDQLFRSAGYGGTFSHFGVGPGGEVYQWQDTAHRAAANLNGNHRVISIETADRGRPFPDWDTATGAVPPWTDEQLDALAQLIAALCTAHGMACRIIPDTLPGRRGVAYHRQGIDGPFLDHRVPDGELWSSARGKVCPGDARIGQIPAVLDRARALMRGGSSTTRPPTTYTEDEMFIRSQLTKTGPAAIGLLSGPMFLGLGADLERASAEAAIKAGAPVLDVDASTWAEIDKRSHELCDNPRPVRMVGTTPAASA